LNSAHIALVTYRRLPDLTDDDVLAAQALGDLNVRTDVVCWDDEAVDWRQYGAIVIRSTWDYHLRIAEFRRWIDRMAETGARLWNPPDVIRWNTDKRYLLTLGTAELRPPPTVVLDKGSAVHLTDLLRSCGWDEAVVKPTVSADGFSTERTTLAGAAADQPLLTAMLSRSDVLVQPLVPEIRTQGEMSLMFFGGTFSHAVSKRPTGGEFRVQERLGGVISLVDVAPSIVARAETLLKTAVPRSLYARVDVVETPKRLVLMEIELVEPTLFLQHAPGSAGAFARAIVSAAAA
jgi:glutathione synthase/RimK-type ligase-like ATP-grasp enzyme